MIQTADQGMKKPMQPVQTAKPQTPQGDPTIVPPGGISSLATSMKGVFGSATPQGGGWGQTPGSTGATASQGMPSTYQSIPAAKPASTYSPPSAPMMPSSTAPQIDSTRSHAAPGMDPWGRPIPGYTPADPAHMTGTPKPGYQTPAWVDQQAVHNDPQGWERQKAAAANSPYAAQYASGYGAQTPMSGFTRGQQPTGMSAAGGQPGGPPDLRGDVYAPTGNGQAGQNTDSLANRLVNYQFPQFNGVAGGSYSPGGDTSTARDMTMQQLKEAQAPDRAGLADSIFTRLEESSNPAFQANLRSVNQRNAAMGRGGSGMVNSELSDVASAREKDLATVRGQLADSAAGLSLSDRLAKLQATQGVFSDLSSNDRSNAGVNLDLRNEARGERTAGLNYGMDKFGAEAGLLGQLGGLEQNRFNQGVTGRNEMRTERGYQTDQAQQGIQNSVQQRMLEDQLLNNATNRQNQTVSTNAGVGYGGNPSGTYLAGADQLGGQAAAGSQSFADTMANSSYLDWLRKQGGVLN